MLNAVSEALLAPDRHVMRVHAARRDGDAVVVRDDGTALLRTHLDHRGAHQACGLARRILHVTFHAGASTTQADVTAVWHRLPHTVPVSLGAAAALVLAGVPGHVIEGVTR
jgi:hypothetical protein